MKRLMRWLLGVAGSSRYRPLLAWLNEEGRSKVPKGHVPVCVGEEMERFVVRAELLGRPAFTELLTQSAQEYGYDQCGVLRIPCSVSVFRQVLCYLLSSDGGPEIRSASDAKKELIGSIDDEHLFITNVYPDSFKQNDVASNHNVPLLADWRLGAECDSLIGAGCNGPF